MRIIKIDEREKILLLVPEIEDDLWHLERVIEKHDVVTGLTDRKIKPKEAGEKAERLKIMVSLDVENVEFHRFMGQLRVSGTIVDGKPAELLDMGAQQSLEISLGKEVRIKKPEIRRHQVERLKKAAEATKKGIVLLVVIDDEQANLARLKEFELEEITTIRSNKSGKRFKADESLQQKYFHEVLGKIRELKPEKAVVAGPGFAKENFQKFLEGNAAGKETSFFFASTNSVGKTGLQELVKGDAMSQVAREMQLVRETRLVERFLAELGKNSGLAEYGFNEVEKAVRFGAVQQLLVADSFLLENREKAENMMQEAEKSRGEVHLINAEHEAGKQLSGLGGVAAILRYKMR